MEYWRQAQYNESGGILNYCMDLVIKLIDWLNKNGG